MQDFEKLGQFYLGREFDQATHEKTENLVLYDSRDLCTHAVVVGMTGSGKTGLCIGLLEEAGIDRIPAIVIDPKGDIANLLLTFPNLSAAEFRPWIDEGQAARAGVTPDVFAAQEAEKWRAGLAKWGQDGARIRQLRETVEMRVYTPGSSAGRPLTILNSFAAPDESVLRDSEALLDRIGSATSGLLALLGIDADPIRSREHILISKLLENAWTQARDMDLGKLIGEIQTPPFDRVGIMEMEAFFPQKNRQELAMTMNNLLASPTFASWLVGEPMDIKRMLHTPEGKPVISIVSIAHLSDQERMFFVTILLNEVLTWMRGQSGTSSLRAILYMDEVFGYFPPTANPPSKKPMLTLLKQARAFGLGCVLATQNPVDLDYKGLSNAGTWFLGRLQTERDKARVLEGLEGASNQAGAKFDRGKMEETLAGLGSRVFLMNNVNEDQPVVFETRWAMSYLRGPLTRNQLQQLMPKNFASETGVPAIPVEGGQPQPTNLVENRSDTSRRERDDTSRPVKIATKTDQRHLIPAEAKQLFVEPSKRLYSGDRLVYRPQLLGRGRLHFVNAAANVDSWEDRTLLATLSGGELPSEIWNEAKPVTQRLVWDQEPPPGSEFAMLPVDFQKAKNFKTWEKELKEFLYREQKLEVWKCVDLKKYSEPNESLGDFKVRLEQLVSEKRDLETEKLRKTYSEKFTTLRSQIRIAESRLEQEESQFRSTRMNSVLSVGSTLMGALLGRKTVSAASSRRASSSVRSLDRSSREKSEMNRAQDSLDDLQVKFEDLDHQFNDAIAKLGQKLSVDNLQFEDQALTPRKSDISVEELAVCWFPWKIDSSGISEPAY